MAHAKENLLSAQVSQLIKHLVKVTGAAGRGPLELQWLHQVNLLEEFTRLHILTLLTFLDGRAVAVDSGEHVKDEPSAFPRVRLMSHLAQLGDQDSHDGEAV